ncbi:MAG: CHASE2 domain-containing protein [Verrucomicrobiota bacterium]
MAKTLPKNTKYRRRLLAAGLALLWALLIALGQLVGAFSDFDQPLLDYRQSLPTEVPLGESDLALVAIDESMVSRGWPLPRLDFAILLRSMLPYNPETVVFENLLHDRDTKVSAFDTRFASTVRSMNKIVFAAAGLSELPEAEADAPAPPANLETIPDQGVDPNSMARFQSLLWPLETFAGGKLDNETPIRVGLNNLLPPANLQPRRVPLVFWVNGQITPSLALQAAASRLDADLSLSEVVMGDAIYLRDLNGVLVRTVPIDGEGRLHMRYRPAYPSPWTATFENVPLYARIAETGGEPEQNLREIKDRVVFVGRTDEQPFEAIPGVLPPTSGVEVQMLATRNILNADYIHPLPWWIVLLGYPLLAVAAGLFFFYYGPVPGSMLLALLIWSWQEFALLAFRAYSLDVPMVSFLVLMLGLIPISFAASHWGLRPVTRTPRPRFRATDSALALEPASEVTAPPAYASAAAAAANNEQLGMGFVEELPAGRPAGDTPAQATPATGTALKVAEEEEEDVEEPDPDDYEKALTRLAEIHEHIEQEEREEAERQERRRREEEVRAARKALDEERRKREAERKQREAKRQAGDRKQTLALKKKEPPKDATPDRKEPGAEKKPESPSTEDGAKSAASKKASQPSPESKAKSEPTKDAGKTGESAATSSDQVVKKSAAESKSQNGPEDGPTPNGKSSGETLTKRESSKSTDTPKAKEDVSSQSSPKAEEKKQAESPAKADGAPVESLPIKPASTAKNVPFDGPAKPVQTTDDKKKD